MTDPQPVRALALAEAHLPKGKDTNYILRLLRTKAKHAKAKAPAKAKRVAMRRILRAAGDKPKTKSDWMREADKWFSRFIRLRDSVTSLSGGKCVKCATCIRWYSIHEIENGHYIRRENWGTRYHEKNCNPQGPCCNHYKGGAERDHARYIDERYGRWTSERLALHAMIHKRKPTANEFKSIAEMYEKKVNNMGGWPSKDSKD